MSLMQSLSEQDETGRRVLNTKDGSFELKLMKEKDKFYLETGFTTEQVSEYLREHKAKAEMEKHLEVMYERMKGQLAQEASAAEK